MARKRSRNRHTRETRSHKKRGGNPDMGFSWQPRPKNNKSRKQIGFIRSTIDWKAQSNEVLDIARSIFDGQLYYCVGDNDEHCFS